MDKRELITALKDFLKIEGFRMNASGAGAVSLVKEDDYSKCEIVFSYLKYPGVYNIGPYITAWKSFKQVENILKPYFVQYKIGLQDITIYYNSRRNEEMSKVDIAKPEDIEKVLPELRTMVYEDILPFFEKYKTLKDVNQKLESLEMAEISKFIFHQPIPRMMIIKRLCNTSDWDHFSNWVIDVYKKMSDDSNENRIYFNMYKALYEELKNTAPVD